MTIDDYIQQRNEIQFAAEAKGSETGEAKWIELGVANRHITRILAGQLQMTPIVEDEIRRCLERAT